MNKKSAGFLLYILFLGYASVVCAERWGDFKADHCTAMGLRQYSARLWDIPWPRSWEEACANMPADINGHHFDSPSRCVNQGTAFGMWGEFDVPDESCPYWGDFKRDECSGFGKRQFSSILHDIPDGISWENACANKGANVEGQSFSRPDRCRNTGVAMWGEFDVNDGSCFPSWGAFKKDHCTGTDKRQYSAVLHNIPSGVSWEDACLRMTATVEGTFFATPSRCKNMGTAMWGEFDISDSSCGPPSWGTFKKDQCTGSSKRQYSAILHNIPEGMSWELACSQTSATVEGTFFAIPSRCKNTVTAMWGEFDVEDASCAPQHWGEWGTFKKDHCTGVGKRQYSAMLHNIPTGIQWETACSQAPADVEGTHFDAPSRCVNTGTAMWGEFDVGDASCSAQYWGSFKKDHCSDSGKRQYSSVLHNIPAGVKWEDACASTAASIAGLSFPRPTRCKNEGGVFMWGEFEVFDSTCSPVTECSDPIPPPGSFAKTGNNGTLSCDAYCANMGGNWGPAGVCAKGRIVSGLNQDTCIRCAEVGRDLGATDVACFCKPQLTGFADTHNHQFANLAFGGQAVWGKPFGPIDEALGHCTPAHGPGGLDDLMFDFSRQTKFWPPWKVLSAGHLVGGYPEFDGWPRFTSTSHQTVYEDWLYRAYEGGLRLMVVLAVNNEEACNFPHPVTGGIRRAPGRTCDDAEAIKLQIEGAKEMERYIDKKHGGPGNGWYRIVYSPQQARDAISSGKLAIVLGVEVDYFLNCRTEADCTQDDVRNRLEEYYKMGIRHVFPLHFVSNGFGDVALSNFITHGPSRFCDQEGYEYQRDPTKSAICGARGLTDIGKFLVKELIRKKMIIDIDHMSTLARNDALTIAEMYKYPVISGHTGFFDVSKGAARHEGNLKANEVKRIWELGGMVSVIAAPGDRETILTYRGEGTPVVDHQCGLTSQTFAQAYLYAIEKMNYGPVGIGTDFNAGPDLPGPRFGPHRVCRGGGIIPLGTPTSPQTARVEYPFPISVLGSPTMLDKSVVGQKTFDINDDGLAHIGLLPDFIEDLKQQGLRPQDLEPLLKSADGYITMWEKAEKRGVAFALVQQIYMRVLERESDPGGLDFWVKSIINGERSIKEVVRAIAKSPEHYNRFIAPNPIPEQVRICYRHLLARDADPGGQTFWEGVVNSQGINSVIDGIIDSQEYQQKFGDNTVPN